MFDTENYAKYKNKYSIIGSWGCSHIPVNYIPSSIRTNRNMRYECQDYLFYSKFSSKTWLNALVLRHIFCIRIVRTCERRRNFPEPFNFAGKSFSTGYVHIFKHTKKACDELIENYMSIGNQFILVFFWINSLSSWQYAFQRHRSLMSNL